MTDEFKAFIWKETGVVDYYPAHFADHPVFGPYIEEYFPEEYEEDKVSVDAHELPVDQRSVVVATKLDELSKDDLVAAAEKHDLDSKGTKADLIERLADNAKEN